MEQDIIAKLEQRLGRVHTRQRLGIEKDYEQRAFGGGINFFHIENWFANCPSKPPPQWRALDDNFSIAAQPTRSEIKQSLNPGSTKKLVADSPLFSSRPYSSRALTKPPVGEASATAAR